MNNWDVRLPGAGDVGALSGTKPGIACGIRRKPLGGAAQFSAGVLALGLAYRCKRICRRF